MFVVSKCFLVPITTALSTWIYYSGCTSSRTAIFSRYLFADIASSWNLSSRKHRTIIVFHSRWKNFAVSPLYFSCYQLLQAFIVFTCENSPKHLRLRSNPRKTRMFSTADETVNNKNVLRNFCGLHLNTGAISCAFIEVTEQVEFNM